MNSSMKERYEAAIKRNAFDEKVNAIARQMYRDIIDSRYEIAPFGSQASISAAERGNRRNELMSAIYDAVRPRKQFNS